MEGLEIMKLLYKIKIIEDSVPLYTGAGIEYAKIGSISNRDMTVIVEEHQGKGATVWGKLQSGAGWIPLDGTSEIIN